MTSGVLEKNLLRLEHLAETLARRRWLVLVAFSLLYAVPTLQLARGKLIWDDEFFTLYISKAANYTEILRALATGADQHPPPFYWLTHQVLSLFGASHTTLRLPAVVGFWMACVSLFLFVSRRTSNLWGLVAMLIPLVTPSYYYASEARGYGLMIGFAGLALISWQAAADGRARGLWTILLAISLAGAVSSHYYAVLILFALSSGELVRALALRRLDKPIWLAFAAPLVPLLLFLPTIRSASGYSAHFWARPLWPASLKSYEGLLGHVMGAICCVSVCALLYSALRLDRVERKHQTLRLKIWEVAAVIGLIALPVVTMVLAKTLTNGFTMRYVLPTLLGVSVALSYLAYLLFRGSSIMAVVLSGIAVLWFGFSLYQFDTRQRKEIDEVISDMRFLNQQVDLPVAMAEVTRFHRLSYYAPRSLVSRLAYLSDPVYSLRYRGHNTVDRGLLQLRPWFPIRVVDFSSFIVSHPKFLVYGYVGNWTWLTFQLVEPEFESTLVARKDVALLLSVISGKALEGNGRASPMNTGRGDQPDSESESLFWKISGPVSLCSQWMPADPLCSAIPRAEIPETQVHEQVPMTCCTWSNGGAMRPSLPTREPHLQ
jgi:hypothetical protein